MTAGGGGDGGGGGGGDGGGGALVPGLVQPGTLPALRYLYLDNNNITVERCKLDPGLKVPA